jgi:hypothetical protein
VHRIWVLFQWRFGSFLLFASEEIHLPSSIDHLYDLVHGGGKERQYVLCSLRYVDHGYLGEFEEILRLCC